MHEPAAALLTWQLGALSASSHAVLLLMPAHHWPPPPCFSRLPPDELLIWREIGFNLCLHRFHQLHSLAALPQ